MGPYRKASKKEKPKRWRTKRKKEKRRRKRENTVIVFRNCFNILLVISAVFCRFYCLLSTSSSPFFFVTLNAPCFVHFTIVHSSERFLILLLPPPSLLLLLLTLETEKFPFPVAFKKNNHKIDITPFYSSSSTFIHPASPPPSSCIPKKKNYMYLTLIVTILSADI